MTDMNDERIPSYGFEHDFEPITLPFDESSHGYASGLNDGSDIYGQQTVQTMFMPPPEQPPDYQALSEAHIYEMISMHGSAKSIDVNVIMADRDNGHGKAMVTVGKDCKERRFEIPIYIKDGKLIVKKAFDLNTDETIDIEAGTRSLFEPPKREEVHRKLDKIYDRYKDFFKGKITDEKIKTLIKPFPSLTEAEASDYLESKKMESKNGSVMFSAFDGVSKYRNQILFGAGVAGAIIVYLLTKDRSGSNGYRPGQ